MTEREKLRYNLLKDCDMDIEKAKKAYEFIVGDKEEKWVAPKDEWSGHTIKPYSFDWDNDSWWEIELGDCPSCTDPTVTLDKRDSKPE